MKGRKEIGMSETGFDFSDSYEIFNERFMKK